MNYKKLIQGILLSFVFVLGFLVFVSQEMGILEKNKNEFLGSVSAIVANNDNSQNTNPPYRNWQVPELNINAESAISVDANLSSPDKVVFKKNSAIKLPIASLTKLMTAVVSLENYSLSKNITVSKEADAQAPMKIDLKLGDNLSVYNILSVMLIESSNKAAYELAEGMGEEKFVSLMNQKAKDLGLENTFFTDPTGLSSENVSTTEDLVKLAKYILKTHPEIAQISTTKEFDLPNLGKITNTNQLLGEVPEIVGGKTGFTTDAKGCLLLVVNNQKDNNYLIYVILGADDRFAEMKRMIGWVNAAYSW